MKESVTIFSDGAAKGNPGRGGFGAVISYVDKVVEIGAFKARTTNNEMELTAVIEALKVVSGTHVPVAIYTDSKYVVEGAKGWIFGWVKNGWKTKADTDVANKELWQELLPLLKKVEIMWHKVPGHVGIVGNERADTIASDFAQHGSFDLYTGPKSGYGFNIEDVTFDEAKAAERSEARKHSAQKAFSYVSAVDGVVMTHATWGECEKRVKGKKGVRFKKSLDAVNEKQIIQEFTQG